MAPTRRAALLIAIVAVAGLALPFVLVVAALIAIAAATAVDAWASRSFPEFTRACGEVLSRGVASSLTISPDQPSHRTWVRQPTPPDVSVTPAEQGGGLDAFVVAARRGHHTIGDFAVRSVGPLGLGQSLHLLGGESKVAVFPDMVAARRLASQVQQGTFALEGRRRRGPIGLGTEFESIRAYVPGDDVRQVNWAATARSTEPMVNQWRLEQDRDVICVIDAGRLMAAPIGDRTRMDAAVDVAAAVGAVADVVGDRAGAVVFRDGIIRDLAPAHRGGRPLAEAIFDVEPSAVESDYLQAFQHVAGHKRALVLVMSDIVEESAGRPLVEAIPVLARRHSVIVASVSDPDLDAAMTAEIERLDEVATAAVALDVLTARRRVVAELIRHGVVVIEDDLDGLTGRVVAAYLRAKALARF